MGLETSKGDNGEKASDGKICRKERKTEKNEELIYSENLML